MVCGREGGNLGGWGGLDSEVVGCGLARGGGGGGGVMPMILLSLKSGSGAGKP